MPKQTNSPTDVSNKIEAIKEHLQSLQIEKKTLQDKIYEGSNRASIILDGINNIFNLISSSLAAAGKDIPLVGAILGILSIIPKSIAFLANPKSSRANKIVSILILAALIGIALAAFIIGSTFALIIGFVFTAGLTLWEGFNLITRSINKYQSSKAYDLKSEFNKLVEQRIIPSSDQFDELFQIRAIELEHELTRFDLHHNEQVNLAKELIFIHNVLHNKNKPVNQPLKGNAATLQRLYIQRKEQVTELSNQIAKIIPTSTINDSEEILDEIRRLQKELYANEESIQAITKPIDLLEYNDLLNAEILTLSISAFILAAGSTVISALILTLAFGSLPAPHIALPILIGFGVVIASGGLLKWAAKKYSQYEEIRFKTKIIEAYKERFINEALINYQHELLTNKTPDNSSYVNQMQELLPSSAPGQEVLESENTSAPKHDSSVLLGRSDPRQDSNQPLSSLSMLKTPVKPVEQKEDNASPGKTLLP